MPAIGESLQNENELKKDVYFFFFPEKQDAVAQTVVIFQ